MTRVFLFLLCALPVWLGTEGKDDDALVRKGDKVPGFVVEMFDGTKVDVEDLRGKVVLVNFWATWCPPCREELKRVGKDIVERFKDREFVYLPISREDSREQVARFREENGYAFPMGLDPEREIFSKFAESGIPRNFVVDADGKIAYAGLGYEEKAFSRMLEEIEGLLEKLERRSEGLSGD